MNEVEKYLVNNFKEENKGNEEYIYLSDEEILKMNPAMPSDYVDYCDRMILSLNKDIESCVNCINRLENDDKMDYTRKIDNKEYIKEERDEILKIQNKINKYVDMKSYYLKQIESEHVR